MLGRGSGEETEPRQKDRLDTNPGLEPESENDEFVGRLEAGCEVWSEEEQEQTERQDSKEFDKLFFEELTQFNSKDSKLSKSILLMLY